MKEHFKQPVNIRELAREVIAAILTSKNFNDGEKEFVKHLTGYGAGFTNQLFELFGKADDINQLRLAQGFPLHYSAIKSYCATDFINENSIHYKINEIIVGKFLTEKTYAK